MKQSPEDDLMLGDLARSGLDAADARRMGVKALTASEGSATGADDPRANISSVLRPRRKKIECARVATSAKRARRSTDDSWPSGRSIATRGRGVELHLPPNLRRLASRPRRRRRAHRDHRGREKAARACKEGIPRSGWEGWSFGGATATSGPVPALAQFAKPERRCLSSSTPTSRRTSRSGSRRLDRRSAVPAPRPRLARLSYAERGGEGRSRRRAGERRTPAFDACARRRLPSARSAG